MSRKPILHPVYAMITEEYSLIKISITFKLKNLKNNGRIATSSSY
jgi:hypothetical protein